MQILSCVTTETNNTKMATSMDEMDTPVQAVINNNLEEVQVLNPHISPG